ncbi:glycoside hydrolase family 75 protein [Biscogniauxia marginata]|nr:glycoside hydrolase family 75 protein [Biscogniauxia marginata]
MYFTLALFLSSLLSTSRARDIPANIRKFYDGVLVQGDCRNKLATGLYSWPSSPPEWSYCGDHLADHQVIYIQGPGGLYTNMDIDCDGVQRQPNSGRCGNNTSDQAQTAFRKEVAGYGRGVDDLDPYVHPFVVFGNSGTQPHNVPFRPQEYGIEPLSVMAVVCPDKLVYAVWGDTQGGERDASFVGEASLALGELCYGEDGAVGGGVSHESNDVMYIAFTGPDAVPGADGAAWDARNKEEFEESIAALGDKLIQRI